MMQNLQRWPCRPTIVVGVDGSSGSKVALRWALEQAARTAADVEAVNVWAPCPVYYAGTPVAFAVDHLADAAQTALLDTLVEVTREYGRSVPIRPRVLPGSPAEVLLHVSRSAQLLVLGAPAHGIIARLLRGIGQSPMRPARDLSGPGCSGRAASADPTAVAAVG